MTESEWVDEFSFNLQALMRENDISQKLLSELTGISGATISRYLNPKNGVSQIPGAIAIVKMAYALNCDVSDLVDFGETIE